MNVNGARSKAAEMETAVEYVCPDVIIGCESKLSDKIKNSEVFPREYQTNIIRKDRNDHGGGVFMAFKDGFSVTEVPFQTDAEIAWASLQIPKEKPILMCTFYRPPGSGAYPIQELQRSLEAVNKDNKHHVVIAGDVNCGHIDWDNHSVQPGAPEPAAHHALLELLDNGPLVNTQQKPTREGRILDLFITSDPSLVVAQSVIPGVSDHDMIVVDSNIKPTYTKATPRKIFSFNKADWKKLKEETVNFTSSFLKKASSLDVEANWTLLKSHLQRMMDKNIPSKFKSTRINLPWFSRQVKRSIKLKQRRYNKAKKTGKKEDWAAYRRCKRAANQACRQARSSYISNVMTSAMEQGNSKPFWSYVKAKRQTSGSGISPLLKDGSLQTDPQVQANILNEQFCSVFTEDKGDHAAKMQSPPFPTIEDLEISTRGVEKLLLKVNERKACGPDQIPNRMLRELALELAPALTFIFNQSLKTGTLPRDWREANIAPIFKKGNKNCPANYRPVSLTCVCAKLMEHIVVHHIMKHLEEHNILTDLQHGFRAKRSCVTQLITTVSDFINSYDHDSQSDVIILDFSKAFDVVCHRKLIHKLHHYGIRGDTLRWITAFLNDRTQQVVVSGRKSTKAPVRSGVPQGTCLGPILFLCYINDITDNISSQLRLFADDALLYREIRTMQDQILLQQDLEKLERWAKKWDMSFNPKKCHSMSITKPRASKKRHFYSLCGEVLSEVSTSPYLGVVLSEDLSFRTHINGITNKANRTLGFLSRTLHQCPQKLRETAYFTMCRTSLEYASQVWDPKDNSQEATKIERIQRRAARFVVRDHRTTSSVTEILRQLEWEPLASRRKNHRLLLLHQIQHKNMNINLGDTIKPGLRGRLRQHTYKTDVAKHSFVNRTVREWNSLEQKSRTAETPEQFVACLPKACY